MPKIGDILGGKYRLVDMIGAGGMGEVYEAQHVDLLSKKVAIKVLKLGDSPKPDFAARFQREGQVAAAVGHRGVIDIYDTGMCDDGAPYQVMELLRGESLNARLRLHGAVEVPVAAYICCQVLSALAAVHAVGVVHRDLKPENIFLVNTGAALPDVKLLDFGISHLMPTADLVEESQSLTSTGTVIGTPRYMSPEQARGRKEIDNRSDVFSLGGILYACVAGRPPFDETNAYALVLQVATEEPPPLEMVAPEVPEAVSNIIHKALEKDPADRYQSATQMLKELLPFVEAGARSLIPLDLPLVKQERKPSWVSESEKLEALAAVSTASPPDVKPPEVGGEGSSIDVELEPSLESDGFDFLEKKPDAAPPASDPEYLMTAQMEPMDSLSASVETRRSEGGSRFMAIAGVLLLLLLVFGGVAFWGFSSRPEDELTPDLATTAPTDPPTDPPAAANVADDGGGSSAVANVVEGVVAQDGGAQATDAESEELSEASDGVGGSERNAEEPRRRSAPRRVPRERRSQKQPAGDATEPHVDLPAKIPTQAPSDYGDYLRE